jgi:mRNA interferase RelE/StbE
MYSIRILRRAIKDIANLPAGYTRLISQHIDRLGENPRPPNAKKLQGETGYSLRVGMYRILYDIDANCHKLRYIRA